MLEWLFGKKKEEPKPEVQKQKKKKKSQSEQETEDRWQYQFLVQFLNSPLWRVSILDFVDHNCVVFDSQQQNKFQYTKIHNQFKQLVGSLFDGMMREIGLDDDKLVQLLEKGFQSKEKKLFNQLLYCDDFLKFKQLMVKRNKALEAEAVKAMHGQQRRASTLDKQRSIVHSSLKMQENRKKQLEQQEQEQLRKALQVSRLEAEQKNQIQKLAQKAEELEQQKLRNTAIEKQQNDRKARQAQEQAARQQQIRAQNEKSKRQMEQIQRQTEQKLKSKVNKQKNLEPLPNQSKLGDLPPLKTGKKEPEVVLQKKEEIVPAEETKKEVEVKQQPKQQAKGESAEERKKRLLEQRQKIRKKKQEERKKMLEQEETNNKKTMNIVLQEDNIHDSVHPTVNEPEQKVSKDEIERRKEIMRKIKNRIVDDF